MRATGGALKPSKSFWYLIDHKWNTGSQKWEYKTAADSPGEVSIRLPDREESANLTRYEPHESQMTLGIQMAMDGSQDGEREYLRKQAEEFADRLRTAPGLEKNDTWEAVLTQIMSTFKYPAAATQLTKLTGLTSVHQYFQLAFQKQVSLECSHTQCYLDPLCTKAWE